MICDTCEYIGRPSYAYPCSKCDMKEWSPLCMYEQKVRSTNGNRIRSMSDEEFAKWLAEIIVTHAEAGVYMHGINSKVTDEGRKKIEKGCLEWLQQPV